MDKIEQQRQHFDSIAGKYFSARKNKNHLKFKKLLWEEFFKGFKWNQKESLVLEPMCGYSEGEKILKKNLKTKIIYEGFDYSQPLIDEVKKINPELNVYKQDVTKFRPKKEYDIIIIIGGLHHVYRYTDQILKSMNLALKKGGVTIIFEPTQNNPILKFIRKIIYRRNDIFDEETEKAFDLKDLNNSFEKNDLKIKKQIYPGLLGYVLYYNPDAFPLLNKGNEGLVTFIFKAEKFFYSNIIGKFFSFATMTLLQK